MMAAELPGQGMAALAPGGSAEPPGCGCKGIRTCLLCGPQKVDCGGSPAQKKSDFIYCPATRLAMGAEPSDFSGWAFPFPGVSVIKAFVSEDEERGITSVMDRDVWKISQSGRRKQDYGPNVNFKKQKLKVGRFNGLPSFSQEIVKRMKDHVVLQGFLPVEQCNLDYNPERGSAIDPHFDDWWLWGERLVTLNLLSETVLTMSCDSENLQLFAISNQEEPTSHILTHSLKPNSVPRLACSEKCHSNVGEGSLRFVPSSEVQVAIHLPQRSLAVLSGDARFKWKHAIYRKHIEYRRVCCTFRELSAEFSSGGKEEKLGKELLDIAMSFQGKPI